MLIRLVGQHVQLELGIACSGRIGYVIGCHRVLSVQVVVSLRLAALRHEWCGVGGFLPPLCWVLLPALLVRRPVP